MSKPSFGQMFKLSFLEGMSTFLHLPFWWYGTGLKIVFAWMLHSIRMIGRYLGLDVWSKNLFVPMYGDTSFAGRIISFFVRLIVVMAQLVGVMIWSILMVCLGLIYLCLLPVIFLGLLFQFISLWII